MTRTNNTSRTPSAAPVSGPKPATKSSAKKSDRLAPPSATTASPAPAASPRPAAHRRPTPAPPAPEPEKVSTILEETDGRTQPADIRLELALVKIIGGELLTLRVSENDDFTFYILPGLAPPNEYVAMLRAVELTRGTGWHFWDRGVLFAGEEAFDKMYLEPNPDDSAYTVIGHFMMSLQDFLTEVVQHMAVVRDQQQLTGPAFDRWFRTGWYQSMVPYFDRMQLRLEADLLSNLRMTLAVQDYDVYED